MLIITDGTATLSSGALSGATTGAFSGDVTITSTTAATDKTTGALKVSGGVIGWCICN